MLQAPRLAQEAQGLEAPGQPPVVTQQAASQARQHRQVLGLSSQ